MSDNKLIYIAAPFTHKDESVMDRRYHATQRYCMELFRMGLNPISPVVHWYYPAKWSGHRGDFGAFEGFCRALLLKCDEMRVIQLDGWKDSIGVQAEIRIANERGINVGYDCPDWVIGGSY